MSDDTRPANRLIHEQSPYLQQHAHNPVDWYPWGPEAFARAKRDDKPIFLSIGYSTCYWCHVMEQESFDNPAIASEINAVFVPIKVDREERPDLDQVYMSAVMAMSGQGGWPMTVMLTPEGKPFWGGTYFPPEDRGGRPGLVSVVHAIREAWTNRREALLTSSRQITETLALKAAERSAQPLTVETLSTAVQQLAAQYDDAHGGFGPAPKFPRSHALSFLLRAWTRTHDATTLTMVEQTLDAMARGGMHDQLGGGFHRYSTDERWLVPHFEKMLYDQALLARTYLEAYQATKRPEDAEVARDLFAYVLRDLRDPQGGFYCAEDAGEVGLEGEFYAWTPEAMAQALGPERTPRIIRYVGVTPDGNFERGMNVLSIAVPLAEFAAREQVSVESMRAEWANARAALLAARDARPRPHRDEKVLTDWNGLMIGALAYGGRVLGDSQYTEAATQAATFALTHLVRDGRLLHRYRAGVAEIDAFLDDYAFLGWGLLELYETTHDARWLAKAQRLATEMLALFWEEASGGFVFSGKRNEPLIANSKELYDGAVPSGNSVAAWVLERLAQLTMDASLRTRADQMIETFAAPVAQMAHAFPQFLIAVDLWLGPSYEIVIAGDPAASDTRALLNAVNDRFLPRATVLVHASGAAGQAIERVVPFVTQQRPIDGHATAYVCERFACRQPLTDSASLAALLATLSSS